MLNSYNQYPQLRKMTVLDVLEDWDVMDEQFGIPFVLMLEKFINENEDITQSGAVKVASKLLEMINNG